MTNNVILPSFAAGELSPGLAARVDIAKYHVGAALLDNFFVDYKGGASSRPGTQYIGVNQAAAGPVRLYKFVFSATQQYVLVFTDRALQFIRNPGGAPNHPNGSNAGFIQSGGANYSIGTPYVAAELPDLKFAQSADILQITHSSHPRMILERFGDTSWTLTPPVIGATVTSPANLQATITGLPANSTDPQNTTYLYTVTTVDKNGQESALAGSGATISYFALVTGIDMATTPGSVTITWNTVAGAAYYNVYKTIPGYANQVPPYTASFGYCGLSYGNIFIDSNIVPDFTKAPPLHTDPFSPSQLKTITVTGSSADWPVGGTDVEITDPTGTGAVVLAVLDTTTRGGLGHIVEVFIVDPGQGYTSPSLVGSGGGTSVSATFTMTGPVEYPASVAYHQQRLIVASTTDQPTGIFGSKTGFFDNFDVSNPVADNDAFTFILAGSQINAILHMIPMPGGLVLFTNSAIQQLTGGSSSATNPSAITPSSVVVVPQSYFGASGVRPIVINRDILYVQAPGNGVQDLTYNLFFNIYEGNDIAALSSHLFYPHAIVQWDYQHVPFKVVWAVRDDGMLLSMTYLKEQEVLAWAHHDTSGGLFESVTVVREGNADAVYFAVNRGGNRYVERLVGRVYNSPADAWCVDAGLNYSGSPTTVLSGLSHLEGESVTVLGNGVPLGQFTVSGGSITLPTSVTQAVAGVPFTARLQTMQLDLGNEMQTVQGKRKRVAAASIRVRETVPPIKVGTTFNTLVPFVPNVSSTDNMSLSGLVTADMRLIVDPSYNVHGQVCVQQDNPLPVTVLGIIPEIVVGDNGGGR
jgi:hypothetical protein